MSPVGVRRGLHALHALASVVLVATGFLIQLPELRSQLIGGYGLEVVRIHRWVGAAFLVAPLLAAAISAGPLMRDLGRRLGPPDPVNWRKLHIVLSLASSLLLSATGLLLWIDPDVPRAVWEASLQVHIVLTWVITVSLPIHLIAARRKIASVVRVWLRREEPPGPIFPSDDDP